MKIENASYLTSQQQLMFFTKYLTVKWIPE